jgi:hypothetical protein
VARIGAQLSIATPANGLLLETFEDLQSGRADRSEWRHRADRLWEAYARKAALAA